ncbi:MAG: TraR/DksA C4-type zinc finger protein [Bacteroidales bacterium]|nr:TraR/DksA C4-type zinc finger protein [Bacteroidales bacterium]
MDENKISEIKEKIISEIGKTKKSILEYKDLTKPIAPENAIGRVSRMDAINNKSITEAALRKAQEKLKNLEYMLSKVNDDDFGLCVKCKSEIPLGRLILMPQSRYCVRCAQ